MLLYETVLGYFIQDNHDLSTLPAIPPRFGLLDESPERWANLIDRLKWLNKTAEPGTSYILFFLGRHGQGYHNVAHEKHPEDWEGKWSKLDGDGKICWGPDAYLTSVGEGQARNARDAWRAERPFGIPVPDKMYCSPLTRALRTHEITFEDVIHAQKTVVLENCRELYGVHPSEKRRTLTYISEICPFYEIEPEFTEQDELWKSDEREELGNVVDRARQVLGTVFGEVEKPQVVAITTHAVFIWAFMVAVNHTMKGGPPTGGVLPVIVKCSNVHAPAHN
ncbi:hypothetical protein APHAL10511_003382 [Amanita phalloides]|nr:hypothetical protein APHAL10511_003382 [Amanita phalloides]